MRKGIIVAFNLHWMEIIRRYSDSWNFLSKRRTCSIKREFSILLERGVVETLTQKTDPKSYWTWSTMKKMQHRELDFWKTLLTISLFEPFGLIWLMTFFCWHDDLFTILPLKNHDYGEMKKKIKNFDIFWKKKSFKNAEKLLKSLVAEKDGCWKGRLLKSEKSGCWKVWLLKVVAETSVAERS